MGEIVVRRVPAQLGLRLDPGSIEAVYTTAMTTEKKLFTAEDLERLCVDGKNYELLDGELRELSPGNWFHSLLMAEIAALIREYVRPRGLGYVLAGDPGVT